MNKQSRSAIIVSATSDIGTALCYRWQAKGWNIYGTYRSKSKALEKLRNLNLKFVHCDLSKTKSIQNACSKLRILCPKWDVLVMCPGTQEPVGAFAECNFDKWQESIKVNFTGQMHIIHELLPARNVNSRLGPCVLFFAGGGTNNAPVNYSAYTVSKIALIKMCELLDAEIPDVRFVIIGPGWVKTKIHETTLKAGLRAGASYQRTIDKLAGNECTPMGQVLDCCDWIVDSPRPVVGGRNFSVAFDMWGREDLKKKLLKETNMYKLRRYGNDWLVRDKNC